MSCTESPSRDIISVFYLFFYSIKLQRNKVRREFNWLKSTNKRTTKDKCKEQKQAETNERVFCSVHLLFSSFPFSFAYLQAKGEREAREISKRKEMNGSFVTFHSAKGMKREFGWVKRTKNPWLAAGCSLFFALFISCFVPLHYKWTKTKKEQQ